MTVDQAMTELAAISSETMRAINQNHGSAHGANLSQLRKLAKSIKSNHELALELWATEDADARLLALLLIKTRLLTVDDLERMVHEIRYLKTLDWFNVNVMKKTKHAELVRERWMASSHDLVASAGWSLTAQRVVKSPDGLDLNGLLDEIERDMKQATDRKQWSMNYCLAEIGIHHPELRERALAIGERLEVLKDYPTSKGCTSPFAPIWIREIVSRNEAKA